MALAIAFIGLPWISFADLGVALLGALQCQMENVTIFMDIKYLFTSRFEHKNCIHSIKLLFNSNLIRFIDFPIIYLDFIFHYFSIQNLMEFCFEFIILELFCFFMWI